jgi:hypothetical protein
MGNDKHYKTQINITVLVNLPPAMVRLRLAAGWPKDSPAAGGGVTTNCAARANQIGSSPDPEDLEGAATLVGAVWAAGVDAPEAVAGREIFKYEKTEGGKK